MPELGEVAHAAAILARHTLGRKIVKAIAHTDDIVFVKPLTAPMLEETLIGSTVTSVGRQGKYFWLELDSAKTVLLHFGMTGWLHVHNVATHFIAMESGGDKKQATKIKELKEAGLESTEPTYKSEEWPPRFTKFLFEVDSGDKLAFADARRLARVRLIELPAAEAKSLDPLKKLGPDWSQTPWQYAKFKEVISRRRVPVKALLLDQTVFSGIGNWMADEILFQARIHPEQTASFLEEETARRLWEQVVDVCRISAETEANTVKFPSTWLMLHRWGKARSKKQVQKLPSGEAVDYITVGGRTSCYVPSLQVITGDLAATPGSKAAKRSRNPSKKTTKVTTKRMRMKEESSESSDEELVLSSDTSTTGESSEIIDLPEKKVELKKIPTTSPRRTRRTR